MKLAYPFSGVVAIFFPVGKPAQGGTCEFATKKCLKVCAAFKNCKPDNKIPYDNKVKTHFQITQGRIFEVCDAILKNMEVESCEILYWFASGDCQSKDQESVLKVMKYLSDYGIVQMGFTRNQDFWVEANDISNVRVALTVENKSDIKGEDGLFAVPNYKTGVVNIYSKGRIYSGGCSSHTYKDEITKLETKIDCAECHKLSRGCFSDR